MSGDVGRSEWEALWAADPRATPFQHPAWALPHAARFAGEIRYARARGVDGTLMALMPLTVWDVSGAARRWVPLAGGHSDYLDVLARPGWDGVLTLPEDAVVVGDLRAGSPLLAHPRAGEPVPCEVCPVLARGADGAFAIPYNMRRNRTKARNRAAALGGVDVALAERPAFDAALAALVALSGARLGAQGVESTLGDARMRAWLADALPGLDDAGLLRLVVVRHEGAIVTVLLGLADRHRHMSYLVGVDDRIAGQSFGVLAFAHLIDLAEARGDLEFHFLRGAEAYKFAWGAEASETVRVEFAAAAGGRG